MAFIPSRLRARLSYCFEGKRRKHGGIGVHFDSQVDKQLALGWFVRIAATWQRLLSFI
jgi:hypothetical protein